MAGIDPTSVVNLALGFLGEKRITDINDANSALAEVAQRIYTPARRAMLAMTRWHFATGWAKLNLLTEPPAAEWTYQYALPGTPDPVKVWQLNSDDAEWTRAYDVTTGQQVVYTDFTQTTVGALITFDIEDTSKWDSLAVKALAYQIAADISITRTGQGGKWQAMTQAMQFWLGQATAKDGMSQSLSVETHKGLVRVR